jgi:pseudaminic acid synthase
MIIDRRHISYSSPPYVIAEISANHGGSINKAIELIRAAKKCGASAVKLQTYTPDTITIKSDKKDFLIESGLWSGRTLYDLYEEAYTPWEWHHKLFAFAKDIGITIFSSPFDQSAVDFLENLNAPAYKIASFEIVDIPLIQHVARTLKPMIISTGMASLEEINEALEAAFMAGAKDLALLHCVSSYPAEASDYNLKIIEDLKSRFNVLVGLSDHTLSTATAVTSVALGACIIEKHITLNRFGGAPDDSFSLEPNEFSRLCSDVKSAWHSIGHAIYTRGNSEIENKKLRRSLYFIKKQKAGTIIEDSTVKSIRPGYGIAPKYLNQILGKKLKKDIDFGDAVSWDHIV